MTALSPTHLFVYGTLMPGRLRWPLLAPYACGHRPAAAPGEIFDSGQGWPVAAFWVDGDGGPLDGDSAVVPGVLVELKEVSLLECLVVIDEVEDTATDELRRVEVATTAGVTAWAYHYPHSTTGLRRIERWDSVPVDLEA